MKTIHTTAFLGIIFCLFFTGCERYKDLYKTDHIYLNNSSQRVSIDYYFHDHKSEVIIEENGSILQTGYTPYVDRDHIIYSDSVIMTFDNQKKLIHTNDQTSYYANDQTVDRNILNQHNYSFVELNPRHGQFRYVIDDHQLTQAN